MGGFFYELSGIFIGLTGTFPRLTQLGRKLPLGSVTWSLRIWLDFLIYLFSLGGKCQFCENWSICGNITFFDEILLGKSQVEFLMEIERYCMYKLGYVLNMKSPS